MDGRVTNRISFQGNTLLCHIANYLGTRGRVGQVLPFTPASAASIAYQILGSGRRLHMLFSSAVLEVVLCYRRRVSDTRHHATARALPHRIMDVTGRRPAETGWQLALLLLLLLAAELDGSCARDRGQRTTAVPPACAAHTLPYIHSTYASRTPSRLTIHAGP